MALTHDLWACKTPMSIGSLLTTPASIV
jgi:hypothetical protein